MDEKPPKKSPPSPSKKSSHSPSKKSSRSSSKRSHHSRRSSREKSKKESAKSSSQSNRERIKRVKESQANYEIKHKHKHKDHKNELHKSQSAVGEGLVSCPTVVVESVPISNPLGKNTPPTFKLGPPIAKKTDEQTDQQQPQNPQPENQTAEKDENKPSGDFDNAVDSLMLVPEDCKQPNKKS